VEHRTSEDMTAEVEGRQPALLDVKEVAQLLNCSPRTVRRLADSGRMPAPLRLGRLTRWNPRALRSWIIDGCPSCKTGR
jgi:excisionase family DNA binding protein